MELSKFLLFEKELNLFSLTYHDVFFWKLIRIDVFNKLSSKESSKDRNSTLKSLQLICSISRSLMHIKLNKKNTTDIAILTSSVYFTENDGKKKDRILNHIIEEIDNSTIINTYSRNGKPHEFYNYNKPIHYYSHPIQKLKSHIMGSFMSLFIRENTWTKNLEISFNDRFGSMINLSKIIQKSVISFLMERKLADRYFSNHCFKSLYISCSYGREAFIASAKENGVYVIELQHGWIGKSHLGYNFYPNTFVPYFPDKLELMGEFWKSEANYPRNSEITIRRNPFYYQNIEKLRLNRGNSFLFDVAFFFSLRLPLEFIEKMITINHNLKFCLKLHPKTSRYDRDYVRSILKKNKNLFIIEDDRNYYQILKSSKSVITISSTVLFEATSCRIPVYILKDQDYIRNIEFINLNNIPLIEQSNIPTKFDFDVNYNYIDGLF